MWSGVFEANRWSLGSKDPQKLKLIAVHILNSNVLKLELSKRYFFNALTHCINFFNALINVLNLMHPGLSKRRVRRGSYPGPHDVWGPCL